MLCAWLLAISLTQAQVPQLISYQAVARDLTGKVLRNLSPCKWKSCRAATKARRSTQKPTN